MVTRIKDNIYRIRIDFKGSPLKNLNSYFIEGKPGERSLIIDAGFRTEDCMAQISEGLSELSYDRDRTDFLCTHLHGDHTGLAPLLTGPDSRIFISETDLSFGRNQAPGTAAFDTVSGYYTDEGLPGDLCAEFLSRRKSHVREFDDERFTPLPDGAVLSYGGHDLRLLEVPGHSPGNCMFWLEKEKIMFTGDNLLFDISPNISAVPFFEDALGHYIQSLRVADTFPVELACPAHRETGDYHARIRELIAHHEKRLRECYGIVKNEPGLNAYDITKRFRWKIRYNTWEEFPRTQIYFAMSEALAHLEYLRLRGIIRRDENFRYYAEKSEKEILP